MKDTGHLNEGTSAFVKIGGLGCLSGTLKMTSQKKKTVGRSKLGLSAQVTLVQPSPSETEETIFGSIIPEEPKHAVEVSEQCCKKLKLQLFPVNEYTKKVLEEDNFNPYLELTLTTRKKISSVVKHLNVKWGSSKEALGELMLFPFDACDDDNTRHRIWTLKDSDITTADVYSCLGNPAKFRLRYGWSSNPEATPSWVPVASSEPEYSLKSNFNKVGVDNLLPFSVSNKENEPVLFNRACNDGAGTTLLSDKSVQNKGGDSIVNKEAKLPWLDCISNVSFGALLSEASEASSGPDFTQSLYAQRASNFQQMPVTCDSFDAAIAALAARHEPVMQTTEVPHSSIWDAEQTCHAFPSKITTALGQKKLVSSEVALSLGNTSSTAILKNSEVLKEDSLANNVSLALCVNMELDHKSNDGIICRGC